MKSGGWLKPHERIEDARLVVPSGNVSNTELMWIEVKFEGRAERRLLAFPVLDFHRFVRLPRVGLGEVE